MKKLFIASIFLLGFGVYAANYTRHDDVIVKSTMSIGSNAAPNSKSVLDLTSTTKGFLLPRMTSTQRGNISSPTTGLQVFTSTTNWASYYNGTAWLDFASITGAETLTNKTIDAGSNTLSNITNSSIAAAAAIARTKIANGTASHVVINDGSGTLSSEATLAKSRGGTAQDNSSVTFPAAGVIITEGSTSTLTSKTINASSNTITNLTNSSIDTSAAIARSKLASGTASHVLINDGSGVMSSEATLAKARGGTAQDNSSLTFPAAGVIITEGSTSTLTSKTLTSPVITSPTITTPTVDIFTITLQGSTPSNPAASYQKLYFKNDGKLYKLTSGGLESEVGGAGGSGGGSAIVWEEEASAPVKSVENHAAVYLFQAGVSQDIYSEVHVPASYTAGNPIALKCKAYSPDTSGNILLTVQSTLVRAENDDVGSTTNQRTTTNSAITMSSSNDSETQKISFDISDSTGNINSVAIAASDTILVRLYRGTDTATSDIRLLYKQCEVTFQ